MERRVDLIVNAASEGSMSSRTSFLAVSFSLENSEIIEPNEHHERAAKRAKRQKSIAV